jgi:hypothetical protein
MDTFKNWQVEIAIELNYFCRYLIITINVIWGIIFFAHVENNNAYKKELPSFIFLIMPINKKRINHTAERHPAIHIFSN